MCCLVRTVRKFDSRPVINKIANGKLSDSDRDFLTVYVSFARPHYGPGVDAVYNRKSTGNVSWEVKAAGA